MKDIRELPSVIVFPCQISALGIARSLGTRGVSVICGDSSSRAYAMQSKFCADKFIIPDIKMKGAETLALLENLGASFSSRPIIYPTSDPAVLFLSRHRDRLGKLFKFVLPGHELLEQLIDKVGMFQVAVNNGLPSPRTFLPAHNEEVDAISRKILFPCLLKVAYSDSPLKAMGKSMVRVENRQSLLQNYNELVKFDSRLMIQEYIPGEDWNMHIYAAYFDSKGMPSVVFTGNKTRQAPINFGVGTLCESKRNTTLEDQVTAFCRKIQFRGLIDMGLKWDARDGKYKVLDINPRIGQNFRTFVSDDGEVDLAYAQYLDMTERPLVGFSPRWNRKWMIEDEDFHSSLLYIREGRLRIGDWLRSFIGVEEVAFFSLSDWRPWVYRYHEKLTSVFRWIGYRFWLSR